MTEATTKQTPKQIVTARIEGATSRKRGDDGRYEVVDRDFRRIGDTSTTAAGAWKNAADHLAWLDAKQKQAEDFNRQASKPTPPPTRPVISRPCVDPSPPSSLSRKEREKRRKARQEARQKRKINRRRAA